MKISAPGIYDLPEHVYHSDPVEGGSLSSSGAKLLLPPSAPAIFQHRKTHPSEPTDDMIFGSAAHAIVLGKGADIVIVEAKSWQGGEAKQAKAEALAAGRIPLLAKDYDTVLAMAAALRRHKRAAELLEPNDGVAEQTVIWQTGSVWRRALIDFLRTDDDDVVDYKTTRRADRDSIRKTIADYSYHGQGAWYTDAALSLGMFNPRFFLIFQEKTPPYLVTVARPDADAIEVGRRANRKAMDIYARCMETGHWPGYVSEHSQIDVSLPGWAERHEDENSRAQFIN